MAIQRQSENTEKIDMLKELVFETIPEIKQSLLEKRFKAFDISTWNFISNWFKVMWKIDDKLLLKLNGTDYTMYIIFLKHALFVFSVISIFAIIILWPTYATGTESIATIDVFDLDPMDKLTLIHATSNS